MFVRDGRGGRRRARVLLSAFACSPDGGSEFAVGWNRALQTAKICDTWVLCFDVSRSSMERYVAAHDPREMPRFIFVPRQPWEIPFCRFTVGYYAFYNRWQRRALQAARRLHDEIGFDLLHQVTFCGFREPGYLWQLDAPFVWGPVGGTQNFPPRFYREAGWRGAASEAFRTASNALQLRFGRRIGTAARHAAVVLAANSTNRRDFARRFGSSPELLLETGVGEVAACARPPRDRTQPLRVMWCGDYRVWKALPLLIRALPQLRTSTPVRVRIFGAGPREQSWRELAARLGVTDLLEWRGWVPYAELLRQYRWADVFVFTSLRDTAGTVVVEALADGLPVVCLDHHGAGDIVTERCGVKVPVTTPTMTIRALAAAIRALAEDSDRLSQLSRGALDRAHEFLWSTQAARMTELYEGVLRAAGTLAEDRQ